jgi:hypothetical protein
MAEGQSQQGVGGKSSQLLPRTICIFLKNSERRARNTSSPWANFFLKRIGPIWRQASEMSETSSGHPDPALEAALFRSV